MRVQVKTQPACICKMHASLRQPLRFCRWAGMFPVEGLDKTTCTKLRFNMKSLYTCYYCAALLGQTVVTCASTYHFFIHNLSINHLTNLVFYMTNLVCAVFLFQLARNWPTIIKRASHIENRVSNISRGINDSEKYNRILYVVFILSLLEHILSVSSKMRVVFNCMQNNTSKIDYMQQYFLSTTHFIFELVSYSPFTAILYEVVNIQSTFLWNFTDVMTISVSLYLTSYFKTLNKIIEDPEIRKRFRWEDIRLYYSDLVELVQIVDSKMCYLILISFFTNIFFICVQLFSLLNRNYSDIVDCYHENLKTSLKTMTYFVYYSYSFLFLFIRATITSLLAANVNTVAQRPLYVLQHVPTSEYTLEVQRFIRQIRYTTIALSGLIFDVTRGMILTVIATIVKYELVMLQFSLKPYDNDQ